MAVDPRGNQLYQGRLAKIVLDHLMAGHAPDEACAKVAAENFWPASCDANLITVIMEPKFK